MKLVDKYRLGGTPNTPVSNIEIDNLSTLESIKNRQGLMIAAQVATVAAITHQTQKTGDALKLVNDTLNTIDENIQIGFDSLESSIDRLETNLIENLNEIKWYLFNVDKKLDQLINLVKFSSATKSAEFNKQGFVLYKIGSYEESIIQLNKSLEENPLNIEAYINLGFVKLREEKLSESINNFEKAAKLVNEDYSYFEEISPESLNSTKVFILENLVALYAIEEKYKLSIDILKQILTYDLDLKTEITTKYKLAKYHCLIGDSKVSLDIFNEFIERQYFEPIALAVSNVEFESIQKDILENCLQDMLVDHFWRGNEHQKKKKYNYFSFFFSENKNENKNLFTIKRVATQANQQNTFYFFGWEILESLSTLFFLVRKKKWFSQFLKKYYCQEFKKKNFVIHWNKNFFKIGSQMKQKNRTQLCFMNP
jgi:tetratricopeptide (TPR) repeat protein